MIIIEQVHQALQANQSGKSDVSCIACISDCLKGFPEALDKVGNIEYPSFVIARIGVKPAEIGIAIVNRFLEILSRGVDMDTAAANAVFSVDL